MKPGVMVWGLFFVFGTACGDNQRPVEGTADANSSADTGTLSGPCSPSQTSFYQQISDFDVSECDPTFTYDMIGTADVLHLDVSYGGSLHWVTAMRLDSSSGLISLQNKCTHRETQGLWFRDERDTGESVQTRATLLCGRTQDGGFKGRTAFCNEEECAEYGFVAYKVDDVVEQESKGLTVQGEIGFAPVSSKEITVNVRQKDGIAYVARYNDGMRIVDLRDLGDIRELAHVPVDYPQEGEIYNDLKLVSARGHLYALIASDMRGMVVIDVTDPVHPEKITAFPEQSGEPINVHSIFVEGTRAYLANINIAGVSIVDVEDPTKPIALGTYVDSSDPSTAFVHDLFVKDEVAYLNYWGHGLQAVNMSNSENSAPMGGFDEYDRRTSHAVWVSRIGGRQIAVHGDEDFGAHVRILDVTNPEFVQLAEYQTRKQVSVHNIMNVGDLSLITYYQDGLRVLDLAEPSTPREVAFYRSWPGALPGYGQAFYEGAIGVDYDRERNLILLADTHRGLIVLSLDSGN